MIRFNINDDTNKNELSILELFYRGTFDVKADYNIIYPVIRCPILFPCEYHNDSMQFCNTNILHVL